MGHPVAGISPVALRHAFGVWLCVLFRGAIMLDSEQTEQTSHMARGASCRSCRSMDPSHWKVRIHPLKDFWQCYGFDGLHRNDRTALSITFWIAAIFSLLENLDDHCWIMCHRSERGDRSGWYAEAECSDQNQKT